MKDLAQLRSDIDKIDDEILEFLVQRFKLAEQVKAVKSASGQPALDPKRWQQIEDRLSQNADKAGLNSAEIAKIYGAIHEYVLNNIYQSKG